MNWTIDITARVKKQMVKLPGPAQRALLVLLDDLRMNGPTTGGGWRNYGKLVGIVGDKRHCHFLKGKPTYVCCWEVVNKQVKILEVYYAGTHENAPY